MRCARPAISSLLLLLACGVQRPPDGAICPTYETAIRPLVTARCAQCHAGEGAKGGYTVGPYLDTVSRDDDGVPRITPDRSSPFLRAVRGELDGHAALAPADAAKLEDWVIRCLASPRALALHPVGWSTPTDPKSFHGAALRASFYDFGACENCHGEDLRGGKSGVDCQTCHAEGPLACNTCHGDATSAAPPRDLGGGRAKTRIGVGAHRAHAAQGCGTCHLDVQDAGDEGHYRRRGVFSKGPAEVLLKPGPRGAAFWNRPAATCGNTYCHAPSTTDTAPSRKDPVWTMPGSLDCGSCHGAPPSSHASADAPCTACHDPDPALHVNGKVDVKGGGQGCDACHAGPQAQAFTGLTGKKNGAHDAHLKGGTLRGPMGCDECHLVPATLTAPGHLDAPPADVFPQDLGGLAWKFGAVPSFDRATGTCTTYCHGSGNFGHVDTAPGLNRAPTWDAGSQQAACGTCHGLPPIDGTLGHSSGLSCATCHGKSVLPDGGIRFTPLPDGGVTSQHLDGKITGS